MGARFLEHLHKHAETLHACTSAHKTAEGMFGAVEDPASRVKARQDICRNNKNHPLATTRHRRKEHGVASEMSTTVPCEQGINSQQMPHDSLYQQHAEAVRILDVESKVRSRTIHIITKVTKARTCRDDKLFKPVNVMVFIATEHIRS